jgi:hypothetical protein
VAKELAGKLPDEGDQVRLYRALTQGEKGKGQIAKAVPSAGSELVLPASKPVANHVLLGRAPYESAKLQPVADGQVLRGDDATARFLDHSPWLQYSFVCRGPDRALSFFKGGLLVVPDGQWPAEYAERELVFSAEDEKSRSGWRDGKARHREEARLDCPAMLTITEAFGPGSCVAVPLVQRDVRERERVPAKADSPPRASKRKREEPGERRVRQRTDIGATAAPRAGNPVSNASFALPGRHKQ